MKDLQVERACASQQTEDRAGGCRKEAFTRAKGSNSRKRAKDTGHLVRMSLG